MDPVYFRDETYIGEYRGRWDFDTILDFVDNLRHTESRVSTNSSKKSLMAKSK